MKLTLRTTRDTLSPDLRRRAQAVANPEPILRAMGAAAVQLTKRAFNESGLRPSPWPAKADGSPATLRKDNVLSRSPDIKKLNRQTVHVGSDREYAAIHQLGGRTRPMPARPFFPFTGASQTPTDELLRAIESVVRARVEGAGK